MTHTLARGGAEAAALRELVCFKVAEQEFCVDVLVVRELRGWSPATPLPRAPAYMLGVINLRGTVLPIVDMSARLGLAPCRPTPRHVIIVASVGGRTVGLLVDGVSEILATPPEAIQPTPDMRAEDLPSLVTGLVTADGRLIGLLALDALLPPEEAQAA
jgi:purine-binding chemotaxis protein CheW